MKVLIISAFPPEPAPEANHALHICEHLADSELEVHVLCKKGSIAATRHNIVIHPVIHNWTWRDLPSLAKCLRECRPDVILLLYIGWVFNHNRMITFLPSICKKVLPNVPCITQFETVDTGPSARSIFKRVLRKAIHLGGVHPFFGTLLSGSSAVIALSTPHRARLIKQDADVAEKTVILPPPPLIRFCQEPPAAVRQAGRIALGAAEDDFVVVYWGYIYPGKGVETLLQAFRIVCRHKANIRLVLVGGSLDIGKSAISCDDYYQKARRLPEKLGIDQKVTWTGNFSWNSDEGSRYLHAGDACVLPFDYGVTLNNSSLAAACTHGLPVIGTELTSGRDEALEHGRNIYLCRPRNPEMLAEAILMISDNAGYRERLRTGALSLAREWHDWETTTQRLLGILETAVSSREAAGAKGALSRRADHQPESGKKRHSPDYRPITQDYAPPVLNDVEPHLFLPVRSGRNTPEYEKENAPRVSVIVAVYNVEKYLSQCLDSLVNQTLKDIEIIVVNDASTDNSAAIIDDYKSRYPQIRVFNCLSNRGLASVRNIGMLEARGEYIAFTDGDDWADVRMCEVMYQRAREDDLDVLIGSASVFYEGSKTFGRLFDSNFRQTLNPRLRTMPFDLTDDSSILLLEPVAWTKLYRRSFLQKHALQFEDGMNSYEDICFHFSVLLNAKRISLIDEEVLFYRQNRPGQISARTDRKIFEVFDIFSKICGNLAARNVSAEIWAMLLKVELRQFDWLLKDRVPSRHKREFMALIAEQFRMIPECGFRSFARQARHDEIPRLFCMRRKLLRTYERIARSRLPLYPLLNIILQKGRLRILKSVFRSGLRMLRRGTSRYFRFLVRKSVEIAGLEKHMRRLDYGLHQLAGTKDLSLEGQETLVKVCRIRDHVLFLSGPFYPAGLTEAIARVQSDYYLSQTAIFREGDTLVDIGAHVGVFSLYLAKKYSFITVYAVEPDPLNYAFLERNIELNGLSNVIPINKAVSGDGQRRMLYVDALDSTWSTTNPVAAAHRDVLRTVQVGTVTLEQLFQEYKIGYCRCLKVTAPGNVGETLNGLTRTGCVDFLCGDADIGYTSRAKIESESWRIARFFFWRICERQAKETVSSWIQQLPAGCCAARQQEDTDRLSIQTEGSAQTRQISRREDKR